MKLGLKLLQHQKNVVYASFPLVNDTNSSVWTLQSKRKKLIMNILYEEIERNVLHIDRRSKWKLLVYSKMMNSDLRFN